MFLPFLGVSQVAVKIAGSSNNIESTVYTLNVDPSNSDLINFGYLKLDIELYNNTGTNKSWRITRSKVSAPSDWTDQLCIPGECYSPDQNVWSTPASNPINLNAGSFAVLNIHISPNSLSAGTGRYKYSIGDGTTFEANFEIQINFTLGVKAVKPTTTFSISPNPASDYLVIASNNADNATVKIIDVLGNNVFNDYIPLSKKIDVSEFKNGVYFITIETSEAKVTNRKLVIRH